MPKNKSEVSTLKTGKYSIEFSAGGTMIYAVGEGDEKEWIATVADPDTATQVVEGLILVEQKRFYHPDSAPVFTTHTEGGEDDSAQQQTPTPPFLKLGDQTS